MFAQAIRFATISRSAFESYPLSARSKAPSGKSAIISGALVMSASLPAAQLELDWLALIVDARLDFCREAAPAAAKTTISTPFLPSRHVGERERQNCRSSEHRLHGLEYLPP